jgi:hypothetical protein
MSAPAADVRHPGRAALRRAAERKPRMRFMMLMIPRAYQPGAAGGDQGGIPSAEAVAQMMAFNEDLQKAGALMALDGLHPLSKGARIAFSGGKPFVTDGPFAEAKEVLGGFWILKVDSKEEAVEWARRCPAMDGDVLELRQIQELSDFPQDVVEAARENAPSLVP